VPAVSNHTPISCGGARRRNAPSSRATGRTANRLLATCRQAQQAGPSRQPRARQASPGARPKALCFACELSDWLRQAEALLSSSQPPPLATVIAALLAIEGLSKRDTWHASAGELAHAASSLVALARHAGAAQSPPRSMQCHVCRAAGLLGRILKKHGTLAAATKQDTGYRAAVSVLLDAAACEDVSYTNEINTSQAVCAQAHLGHASARFWQRLLDEGHCADLSARAGSNVLWARASLYDGGHMGQPDEAKWNQLCCFLKRHGADQSFARDMNGQAMSSTLWAGAKVGLGFQAGVLAALVAALPGASDGMGAQGVANSPLGCARCSPKASCQLQCLLRCRPRC
jgi:hypothetical protein